MGSLLLTLIAGLGCSQPPVEFSAYGPGSWVADPVAEGLYSGFELTVMAALWNDPQTEVCEDQRRLDAELNGIRMTRVFVPYPYGECQGDVMRLQAPMPTEGADRLRVELFRDGFAVGGGTLPTMFFSATFEPGWGSAALVAGSEARVHVTATNAAELSYSFVRQHDGKSEGLGQGTVSIASSEVVLPVPNARPGPATLFLSVVPGRFIPLEDCELKTCLANPTGASHTYAVVLE